MHAGFEGKDNQLKLSCVQMMLGDRPLPELFSMAQESGFDGIDLRGDLIVDRTDDVRALVQQTGFPVPALYGRITIPLLCRTIRERVESLDLVRRRLHDAAAIGASNLVAVPIFGDARMTVDRGQGVEEIERAMLLVLLSELAEDAEAVGVRIVIEPLNRKQTHFLTSPTMAAELTRDLASPWVGTMVDTFHMDLENQNAVEEFGNCGDQLMLVHLADRQGTLPGAGGIDLAPMLQLAESQGYSGFMGYECKGPFEVDELRRSVDWVRAQATGGRS